MKIVTSDQMRQLEGRAAEVGLTSEALMEKAGLAFAREVRRLLGDVSGCPILVLVGPGNNGGDGLIAARHLHDWGAKVHLYLCGKRDPADKNLSLARERAIPVARDAEDENRAALRSALASAKVVIDALFGTGRLRPLEGVIVEVLREVAKAREGRPSLTIVALDLPSGLDADTGAVDTACLFADVTVTLGYPKLGLYAFPGAERVGQLVIADIGIPSNLADDVSTELITADWVQSALPKRPQNAHKGSFGRVLVVAGSINYIGAAYLACSGATRVGAGLVTLAIARSLLPILASKLTEVTFVPLPEAEPGVIHAEALKALKEWLPSYEVLLVGCGLGQHPATVEFLRATLLSLGPTSSHQLVLDADALNALARTPDWWRSIPGEAVLTPHPGEMARLTGVPAEEIQSARLKAAQEAARRWDKTVVLKGAYSVVASPKGKTKLSPIANPGLASAGTGDVLSGVIAGMLAQGISPFAAACCGVYLHSEAGERVRGELGEAGMLASDLLPALPLVLKSLRG